MNYYISPSVGLKLHRPAVLISQPGYIVFKFLKKDNQTLMNLMNNINTWLSNSLKSTFYIDPRKTFYPFFSELQDAFTLRCSLPQSAGRYNIHHERNGIATEYFQIHIDTLVSVACVDFRNIWELDNKLGYNLELKYICTL